MRDLVSDASARGVVVVNLSLGGNRDTEWEAFAAAHIPGAINLPITDLMGRVNELAAYKDAEMVVHCEAGPRAGMASWILKRNGFTRLVELDGHMRAWRDAGLPLAK